MIVLTATKEKLMLKLTIDWATDDEGPDALVQIVAREVQSTLNDKVTLVAVHDRANAWPEVTLLADTRMDLADWLEDSGYVVENTDDVEFYVNMAVAV
jgi:hypothetical protein